MGFRAVVKVLKSIWEWRNPIIVILVPLILLPIPVLNDSKVSRCAYAVIIIGVFWVTEALPIAVTSLLPVLLFPLLGVLSAKEICTSYVKDTLMLFLGSLIVAVAVEEWNLHKRIALRALTLVGPEPRWLMLGIMLPCWFLSMWMSNTATTAMMVPILNAILSQIRESRMKDGGELEVLSLEANGNPITDEQEKITIEMDDVGIVQPSKDSETRGKLLGKKTQSMKDFEKLAKCFALCTAYAANAGGIATLTGTPPNIVFKGQADILFAEYNEDSKITFANWLVAGFPISVIVLAVTWLWMQFYYQGISCFKCCSPADKQSYQSVKTYLRREYDNLGSMSFAEWVVLADFVILALLWVTRNPQFVPGWGSLFPKGYVGDSVAAILMGSILFVLPSRPPRIFRCGRSISDEKAREAGDVDNRSYVPLLNWQVVNAKMAWGVILLMGGGFALADACAKAGLSQWISEELMVLQVLPSWVIGLLLSYIIAAVTNITSNAATATLFLPIVGELAIRLEIHPLYFMIPCAIAASFAYMLPVGTPPNAIVFSTGYLQVKDMIIGGSFINLVSVLIMVLCVNAWVVPFFNLNVLPDGFKTATANFTTTAGPLVFLNASTVSYAVVP